MTSTPTLPVLSGRDDPAAVLDHARKRRRAEEQAARDVMEDAATWLAMHSADSLTSPADDWHERAMPIGGEGCPEVAEFAVAEWAAAMGTSTEAGRRYLSRVAEGRYRLSACWQRILSRDLPAWRLGFIADRTMALSPAAARFVDAHVAPVAHKIGPAQLVRLIEEAKAQFDPGQTEKDRLAAAEHRHADVGLSDVTVAGTVHLDADVDLADGLDLDAVLAAGAAEQLRLGSTDSLDVRRSKALGMLARGELSVDLDTGDIRTQAARRTVVLHVHVSQAAVQGVNGAVAVARLDEQPGPVSAEQVREWCGTAAKVVVKPVVDLNRVIQVDSYEIPDRLAEQVRQRDRMCVFPNCTRHAKGCDIDHIRPYDRGGTTSSDNLAALCRRHHRHKTTGGWAYWMIQPGRYLWRSPLGHFYVRDHSGTTDVRRAA